MSEPKKVTLEGRVQTLYAPGGHESFVLLKKDGARLDLGEMLDRIEWSRKNVRITVEELP
jgi:hypothetical protein